MEPSTPTPAQPRPSTAVFRHPPRSVAFNHKVQPRPSIQSVVLTFFLSLRRRVAPTFRGKTCLLATNQSKLEKAQADYDEALRAYNSERELLKTAEESLGKAIEAGVEGERLQFLKGALANAKDALANAEKDKDFARKMLEEEMKKTPQSEASEVAKKCLSFQFLTGCVVFCLKHAVIFGLKGIGLFMFWLHQCIRCPFLGVWFTEWHT